MTNVKDDFVKPIVVLTVICLVISAALGITNKVTSPIIKGSEASAAEAARIEVLPEADAFELMELSALPDTVTEVYKASNGVGYVFMLSAKGYSSVMSLICGIDSNGNIVSCKTLSQGETQGLGSKTADEEFRSQFTGADSSMSGISAISGATISSMAYINAVKDAFTAYEIAKGAE